MDIDRISKNKESFGFGLFSIALVVCYILITRIELIFSFQEIYALLDDNSQVKSYFILSFIALFILSLLSFLFFISFLKRKRNTRSIFLCIIVMYLSFPAASYYYGYYIVGVDVDIFALGYIGNLMVDTMICLFVLLPYIFFSKKAGRVLIR